MFSPVVPDAAPKAARHPSVARLSIVTTNDCNGSDGGGLKSSLAGPASPRRGTSKRVLSIKEPTGTDSPTNGGRRQSIKFFHRKSTRRSINSKKETPPHLLKLLEKTPEQKAQLDGVKSILSEEPSTRHEGSLDLLYDWMMHNCKQYSNNIFGSAPEYIRREICRQMRLIKCLSNQLLIRQGDTGDRCYIVIDGLVDVYVKIKETVANPDNPDTPTSNAAANANPAKDYGNMVANLGPGAMFGEVVLLNPSARRNATIIASQFTEQCDLICLERADYIRLVRGASMEASHYNQAEILDQMYLFQGWEKQDKMKLVSAMRSVHFSSNNYLYRAGSDAKWMYIISSGDVVERVNWTVGKQPASNITLASGGAVAVSSANSNSGSGGTASGSTAPNSAPTPSHTNSDLPEKKVSIDLLLVGPADVVGELPFVKGKWSTLFDVKAVTDVQALALDRRMFENMIVHADPATHKACHATWLKLQRLTSEREDWRQQRLACGASYPSAHISITWQLMRMSNLRCSRCGQRGHLASDIRRCSAPPSPKRPSIVKKSTVGKLHLPPLNNSPHRSTNAQYHKKMTLIGSNSGSPRRNSATRDLFDESYLPSAHEQLAQCRLDSERQRIPGGASMQQHNDR